MGLEKTRMGTWGVGPFDTDLAADWSGLLDDASPDQREPMIRAALADVLDEEGYLDSPPAVVAIAAAAVLASLRPGGPLVAAPYGPDFLLNGETLDLPSDLDALAVRALDRIVADESEWRSLWAQSDHEAEALAVLQAIRATLVT
jgi:hypothetical protein